MMLVHISLPRTGKLLPDSRELDSRSGCCWGAGRIFSYLRHVLKHFISLLKWMVNFKIGLNLHAENKANPTQCPRTKSFGIDSSLFGMSLCSGITSELTEISCNLYTLENFDLSQLLQSLDKYFFFFVQPLLESTKAKLSQFCHVSV